MFDIRMIHQDELKKKGKVSFCDLFKIFFSVHSHDIQQQGRGRLGGLPFADSLIGFMGNVRHSADLYHALAGDINPGCLDMCYSISIL